MKYNYNNHLKTYSKILESWLLNGSPDLLKDSIRFYSPTSEDKKRYNIVSHSNFSQIDNFGKLKIPINFCPTAWAEDVECDAIITHDAIVKNGCVIAGKYLFSEVISRNVGESLKNTPNNNLKSDISLCKLYRYYSYDLCSKTAVLDIKDSNDRSVSDLYFLFDSLTGTKNFGHFLHDTLSQIGIYDYAKSLYPELKPVVIGDFKYPMLQFLFKKLVQNDYLTIGEHQQVHFAKLIIPRKITNWFGPQEIPLRKSPIDYLKFKIQLLAKELTIEAPKNNNRYALYISRKDGNSIRSYENQSNIENLISRHNIQEVIISQLDPESIIKLFYSANLIIGTHGAGLMNYVFSKEPITLIEIEPTWKGCPRSIRSFGKLYGINCLRVRSMRTNQDLLPEVDLEQLSILIEQNISK